MQLCYTYYIIFSNILMEFIISWLYNDKYVKTNNFEFYFFCFFDTNLCKSYK